MQDLHDRVVLLTGASRGIGVFIARRLASEGVRLAIVARNKAALDTLGRELEIFNCKARTYETDIMDTQACDLLVKRVLNDLGPVEILINNAGIERTGFFEQQSFATSKEVVEVNLLAPLRLIHAVLPGMLDKGSGHIVMIGSMAGLGGLPHAATYAATKAALHALANSLRLEFHNRGVSASTVIPGFVNGAGMYEDQKIETGGYSAPSILGSSDPTDVADAVVHAIHKDEPEILVNSYPLRFTLTLSRLFPRFGLWLVDRYSLKYTKVLAAARAAK